jgi:hypothetical protein
MKFIVSVAIAAMLMLSCKDKKGAPDQNYCQGSVALVIDSTADGEELSRQLAFECSGLCPGDKFCEKYSRDYNPPGPNGLVKEEWCACPGDTIPPQDCDIFLRTYRDSTGQLKQRAECTAWNTCPEPSDSCLLRTPRKRVDTIRSIGGQDSIYRHKATQVCDCD